MKPEEKLKEIEKWPDYAVNKLGHVYSFKRNKYLRPYSNGHGYLQVNLRNGKKRKQYPLAKLVLETFCGQRPKGLEAAHLNGNKSDNRLENLKWCTRTENENHKRIHGTLGCGEKNSSAKLKWTDVILIRDSKDKLKQLSKMYGVSEAQISMIKRNKRWNAKSV